MGCGSRMPVVACVRCYSRWRVMGGFSRCVCVRDVNGSLCVRCGIRCVERNSMETLASMLASSLVSLSGGYAGHAGTCDELTST